MIYLLLFLVNFSFATTDLFDSSNLLTEDLTSKYNIHPQIKNPKSLISKQLVESILVDRDNKVANDFKIPKYIDSNVLFWFSIYTVFTSDNVVIHDKNNLSLIYDTMDFSFLRHSITNIFLRNKSASKYSSDRVATLKKMLTNLSKSKPQNNSERKLLHLITQSGYQIPTDAKKRKNFFLGLVENLRSQTGQRDRIYSGLLNSLPYLPYMEEQAKIFELPKEILAIPFLESSFNLKAHSKVGASGIWQIMPIIESKLISKDKDVEGRFNPFVATIAAFHLLKQNYRILDSWDLSITAYNSGTKHLLKAIKTLKLSKPSLGPILKNYNHPHIGFASKNFYAEFLALVHVLAYRNFLYPLEQASDPEKLQIKRNNIAIYVAKCPFKPSKVYELMHSISPDLSKLNKHLLKPDKQYSRGNILISDVNLNSSLFYRLSGNEMRNFYPINWHKYVKNYSCSIK